MQYYAIFTPEPEGGYTVQVPSLPGCISYGETLPEAEKMIQEAIELYLETEKEEKKYTPRDDSQAFWRSYSYA